MTSYGIQKETSHKDRFLRLLLADDDDALRRITADQLKRGGYDVVTAADGEEALRKAELRMPDIVVADIMMPKMDGIALLKALRQRPVLENPYILMLTAKDNPGDILAGFAAAADDYMTKPFKVAELIARVNAGARLKRVQLELLEKNRQLEAVLATQARFFGLAAHDLRAPLSIITTYISLLRQGVIDDEEIKQVCLRRARGMMRLVDDVLDITKIEGGTILLEPERQDILPVCAATVDLFRPVAAEKKMDLEEELPAAPLPCVCDAKRISEVLENLIDNAIKYTPEEGRIRVRAGREETEAWVEVSDTGQGISHADLPRIFEPFAQTGAPADASAPRTGLGLAIVRKLIDLHHGRIEVQSPGPGRGSAFRFTLPLAE